MRSKKLLKIIATILLCFAVISCKKSKTNDSQSAPAVPANVKIEVTGRWAAISWDAVADADGYIVYAASEGCGSGNRIINTKTKTTAKHNNEPVTSVYPTNGSVEFTSDTQVRIWLMPEEPESANPMAKSISAKVMALSGSETAADSDYSETVSVAKADYK